MLILIEGLQTLIILLSYNQIFGSYQTFKGVFGKGGGEIFFFQYDFLKVGLGKSWFARNDLCLDP